MKRKNKGFTLIELLAVIVILGIILTIVVSNVVKYISKARVGAFKDTYVKVLREVKNNAALKNLGDSSAKVACNTTAECAALYDVSSSDVDLLVYEYTGGYLVNMEGKGSFNNIDLSGTSQCPSDAGCGKKSANSIITTSGEENNIETADLLSAKIKNKEIDSCTGEDCNKYNKNLIKDDDGGKASNNTDDENETTTNNEEKISNIKVSSSGAYIETNFQNIFLDKNYSKINVENDKEEKVKNFLNFNLIDNYCTPSSYISCGDSEPCQKKSQKQSEPLENIYYFDENIKNDKYIYAKYAYANQFFIFYCKDGSKPTNLNVNYNEINSLGAE